jgi:hypothetical protein
MVTLYSIGVFLIGAFLGGLLGVTCPPKTGPVFMIVYRAN